MPNAEPGKRRRDVRTKLSAEAAKLLAMFRERMGPDGHVDLSGAPSRAELGLTKEQALRAVCELVRTGSLNLRVEGGHSHRRRGGS